MSIACAERVVQRQRRSWLTEPLKDSPGSCECRCPMKSSVGLYHQILGAILRWTARVWGIASTLLLLAFAFGGREHLRFSMIEAVAFLFFPLGIIAGFAVAWRRELAGGLVTI